MCKHIHYICTIKQNEAAVPCQELASNKLVIEESSTENNVIIDELRGANPPLNIDKTQAKEALRLKRNAMLDSLDSTEEIIAVDKHFTAAKPIIDAIRINKNGLRLPCNKDKGPANKKIIPQRRLFSTKKKTKSAKRSIQPPSKEETSNIAMQLIAEHRAASK